jgi:hypothetical protein
MAWTEEEFYNELLYNNVIKNRQINFGKEDIVINGLSGEVKELINCHIIGGNISFENIRDNDLSIRFSNCVIDANLEFRNCIFQNLEFRGIKNLKSLRLSKGFDDNTLFKLNRFYFFNEDSDEIHLQTKFYFTNCVFTREFLIKNINQSDGLFIVSNNIFGEIGVDEDKHYHNFSLRDSNFHNACIERNEFLATVSFVTSKFKYKIEDLEKKKFKNTMFFKNIFQKVGFINSIFEGNCHIWSCKFNDVAYFENLGNSKDSDLKIVDNTFYKYVTFDKSSLKTLVIHKSEFQDITSFQEVKVNTIIIDKTAFDKLALFDDFEIKDLSDCNRRTIRIIKQQLQRAENKIDYNRFRSYELSIFYKELNWNWKDGKDKFILAATWLATGFDHSWRRALLFSLVTGVLFYSLFFISENYMFEIDVSQWKEYASGYFRFLLVTDFYNPLEKDRKYIDNSNFIGWFIFILGKIFIAFGIYEMIQAFRKFKA